MAEEENSDSIPQSLQHKIPGISIIRVSSLEEKPPRPIQENIEILRKFENGEIDKSFQPITVTGAADLEVKLAEVELQAICDGSPQGTNGREDLDSMQLRNAISCIKDSLQLSYVGNKATLKHLTKSIVSALALVKKLKITTEAAMLNDDLDDYDN